MQIAIGTYDHTKGIKDGSVSSPGLSFEFTEVSPITRAFRPMATQQAYDISEMALATYMLARVYGKPILGLPIVIALVHRPAVAMAGIFAKAQIANSDHREIGFCRGAKELADDIVLIQRR